jgi:ribokinase
MRTQSIAVIGSSNTDLIIRVPRIPRAGETLLGGEFMSVAGGKGANQAVGAARSGGKVALIARVGTDAFGDRAIAGLRRDGIDVSQVFRDRRAPSGVALIFVAKDGENSIGVAGGANAKLSPADVKKAAGVIRSAALLVAQLETPLSTVSAAALVAVKAGVPVILNPAPARPLPNRLLKLISILTPNETEAELLTGIKVTDQAAAARACAKLRARGVRTVILTLGARGAYLADVSGQFLVPGFRVKAVDSFCQCRGGAVGHQAGCAAVGTDPPRDREISGAQPVIR